MSSKGGRTSSTSREVPRIIRPAHHPGSMRKFLLLRDCLFGRRRVGDDILRANKELIRDGLFGFSGALTLIALVAFTTKNFAQGNIPSFKMLVYLALAVKLSTIVRRAYATNASSRLRFPFSQNDRTSIDATYRGSGKHGFKSETPFGE